MNSLPSAPPSDDEIVNVIRKFTDERSESGVRIAQAVVDITCDEGVVRVVFDPAATNITETLFREINPFDNLAQFIGTPVAADDEIGRWARKSLVRIETALPDRSSLGSLTADELNSMACGKNTSGI